MWNRIQTIHNIGITVDVIVTPSDEPSAIHRQKVESIVRHLTICRREPSRKGLFSLKPTAVIVRRALRDVALTEDYDFVLLQTEFVSEILQNKTLKSSRVIVRVDNDEATYLFHTARSEASPLLKIYYLQEALRVKWHTAHILPRAEMLWFVSHSELERYKAEHSKIRRQATEFVPSAVDLGILSRSPLTGSKVLFVGNLWTSLNREAIEWYISRVHPLLCEHASYRFVIAGSTGKRDRKWLDTLIQPYKNVEAYFDVEDLSSLYRESAVFVNPMQRGTGVKLKTVEAILRGLPVVSTSIGAEGSGLMNGRHYKCADSAKDFAASISELLDNRNLAHDLVSQSQDYVGEYYNQSKVMARLLTQACDTKHSSGQSV